MNMKIVIATHKEYAMPNDSLYIPVHAGAGVHSYTLPYQADNTGDNISSKNLNFCELTALYWAWKNLDADYIGLCHYRRYFCKKRSRDILLSADVEKMTDDTGIILPKKRNYFIETNYNQYIHAHHVEDLETTRKILVEQGDRRYVDAFDRTMKKTDGHRFNMMIMRRDQLDEYCTWLFNLLFALEEQLDISSYSTYDARVFGFVSERMLDVWLEANNKKYQELPYIFTEKQNWLKKGSAFLKRKFFPKH